MNAQVLLGRLSPFENKRVKLVDDQSTGDIINAMMTAHKKYADDYDQISSFFRGYSNKDTARKIWNFLKENVK